MTKKLTTRFIKAIPWTIGDAIVSTIYGVGMVILLGRLVTPADVGIGSVALATSQIIEALTASGLQEAVIRARSGDTIITDTAHVLALIGSILGLTLCVALGWPLGLAFRDDRLFPLLAVSGLILLTNAFFIVPTAVLARKMRASALTRRFIFGKSFGMATLVVTGVVHLGPWCLVFSGLAVSVGSLLSVAIGCTRWPHLRFNYREAIALLRFGKLIALDSFAWICATKVFAILFGLFHGVTTLGYFQFAQRLVDEIASLLQISFTRLGLAYFSSLERAGNDLKSSFQTGTRLLATISTAIYVGLTLVAGDIVPLLFGLTWTPMVPYVEILSLAWALHFPFILIPSALKAKGRPDILVRFGFAKGLLTLAACIATSGLPAYFGCLSWAAGMVLAVPWSLVQVRQHVHIPIALQITHLARAAIAAAGMSLIVGIVYLLGEHAPPGDRLAIAVAMGGVAYCLLIWHLDPVLRGIIRSLFPTAQS